MNEGPPAWALSTLDEVGPVFATFDKQDSGCVSFGLMIGGVRRLLKVGVTDRARASLARAVALHNVVAHPAIVPVVGHQVARAGTAVLYPWVSGDLLYSVDRKAASSAHARFRRLAVLSILDALDTVFDAHLCLAEAGFVSSDWYDGRLLYDFQTSVIRIIDLDEFRQGPFRVPGKRAYGSSRFMAPEEWLHGGRIDQRTSVYHLARTANLLLDQGDYTGRFRGGAGLLRVVLRGQQSDPAHRHQTVADFVAHWHHARSDAGPGAG